MKGGLTAVLMTMIIAFAGALPAQDSKGPMIVAKEVNHNFGKVVQGKQVSYVFEVRNAGTEPLIIDRVVPSWGCTAAVISSNHLEPGAAGQIKASVDTTGRSGPLTKHVTVYTNDRRNPALSLGLSMEVVQK